MRGDLEATEEAGSPRSCLRRRSRILLGAALVLSGATPALAGGVAIVSAELSDNGDDDGFADTRETVSMVLTVTNTTGEPLTDVNALVTSSTPTLLCPTSPMVAVGDLAAGEIRVLDPIVFTVADVDRTLEGKGPYDLLEGAIDIKVLPPTGSLTAYPSEVPLDLDLDVSGGSGPTTFFESFEETLGQFEIQNLDQGLYGLAASDGYRCQYSDPDWVNSNNFGNPAYTEDCHLGNSPAHADKIFWGLSGPDFSPAGGRGFSGFHSLFFGEDLGPPLDWTTPLSTLEAAGTTDPIHLGWDDTSPVLSFVHQVSLVDSRGAVNLSPGISYDRSVVMAQLADDQGNGVGPWHKIEPYRNVYDQQNSPGTIDGCSLDPIDDGSTEDDFFDPTDPDRRYGPSSTCYPEFAYANIGETSNAFSPLNVGQADGPALDGFWGIGTWIESKFDLSRYRGRSVRIRFLASVIQAGEDPEENWEDIFVWNPEPSDDGWWIDDVTVEGALTVAAVVSNDDADNSSLPQPSDGDLDLVPDPCDNCVAMSNVDQDDFDSDGVGDVCDDCTDWDGDGFGDPGFPASTCPPDNCPTLPSPDQADDDGDGLGNPCDNCHDPDGDGWGQYGDAGGESCLYPGDDNCPYVYNPLQEDGDSDEAGTACDCDDMDPNTYPGAREVNDGKDNQCPGDEGYGVIDETSGNSGFHDPNDKDKYSWAAQAGALSYQVARAGERDFGDCFTFFPTFNTFIVDSAVPVAGQVFTT